MLDDAKTQANMLKALKPLLKPKQQALIDIAAALGEAGDTWVKDEAKADELLKEIKKIIKEGETFWA